MSEANTPAPDTSTVVVTTAPEPTPAPAPSISNEVIEKLQKDITAKAVAESEKRANDLIANHNARIRQAIGDTPKEDVGELFLQQFVTDPIGTVSAVQEKYWEDKKRLDNAERAKQAEFRNAVDELLEDRPDIHSNKAAMKLVKGFWNVDSGESPKESLKQAIAQYDLLMEGNGAGEASKRIEAASSLVRGAGARSSEPKKEASIAERSGAANANWMQQRREMFAKRFGG